MGEMEHLIERKSTEETEVLRKNMLQCYLVHHKSYMNCPGIEPRPPQSEVKRINTHMKL